MRAPEPGLQGLLAPAALLPEGWRQDVEITFDAEGLIRTVTPGTAGSPWPRTDGPIIPGMPNAHSHAFQRALVGTTQRLAGRDDFWTWRDRMYGLADTLQPDEVQALTTWLYADLVRSGYTSVAEFHYLHHAPGGTSYDDPAELSHRIVRAADKVGMRLTLLPVLYQQAGLDAAPLTGPALRFGCETNRYITLVESLGDLGKNDCTRVGLAAHSLRAVPLTGLHAFCHLAAHRPDAPVHIHVAEQLREVDECVQVLGARPVEWLLDSAPLDDRWNLVHATHTLPAERESMIRSGAQAILCPTTEADLGDGVFPIGDWLQRQGPFAIGSDSNVAADPMQELRLLIYQTRLLERRRGSLPVPPDRTHGGYLWQLAAESGARALGQPVGRLQVGYCADLLVLDGESPVLEGLDPDEALTAFVLSGDPGLIERTLVGGRAVCRRGRVNEGDAIGRKAAAIRRQLAQRLA